jgi:hypothetical protein
MMRVGPRHRDICSKAKSMDAIDTGKPRLHAGA